MNKYRKSSWVLALVLLIGSVMAPYVAFGAEAHLSGVDGPGQYALQDCGIFDTNCDDDDGSGTSDDDCRGIRCNDDDGFGTSDDDCRGIRCNDDDGFGSSDDDCRGLYCDDNENQGAPRLERTPYPGPNSDACSSNQNVQIRAPIGTDLTVDKLDCQDDPWGGSTSGCLSYGSFCDDDSFLMECSYVTADRFGSAEGACDVPIGQHELENCFPVSGSSNSLGNVASNSQTFRCLEHGTFSNGGYSIDVISPSPDVVLLLCSPEPGVLGGPDEDTCEDPPRGVRYYTCEVDSRFPVPMGSDGEWYLCGK